MPESTNTAEPIEDGGFIFARLFTRYSCGCTTVGIDTLTRLCDDSPTCTVHTLGTYEQAVHMEARVCLS